MKGGDSMQDKLPTEYEVICAVIDIADAFSVLAHKLVYLAAEKRIQKQEEK